MFFMFLAVFMIHVCHVYSTSAFVRLGLHINLFVFEVLRKRSEEEEPKVEPKKVEKVKKPTGRNLSNNL